MGEFLIGPLPLAERLHHLNALYIFHDHAVHMGVGLHVGGVILVIGPHPEGHGMSATGMVTSRARPIRQSMANMAMTTTKAAEDWN